MSVVVPVRNEAPYLDAAIESILAQGYPGDFDVWLAVAPSDDDTAAVAERIADDSTGRVRVIDNPAGVTPAGLNAAIAASSGSILVRVDGHAALNDGYVRRAVETMCRTGADNVGGRQVPAPETPFEEAVAAATTSWMGTGGATYRVGGAPGPVDTVYLGVFDRTAGDAVGWFDESLIRNQDYELNFRLRAAGGVVWFDPDLAVAYRPRSTWAALAKQYYEYGWWKAEVLRRYPETLKLRQAVPAMLAPMCLAGLSISRTLWRYRLAVAALSISLAAMARGRLRTWATVPVMHLSWSIGFWAANSRRLLAARRPRSTHARSRGSAAGDR